MVNLRSTLTHSNTAVERVLNVLGRNVVVDANGCLQIIKRTDVSVLIMGDEVLGNVTSMFTARGHLILVTNFGDDGYYCFSPTVNNKCELESDLSDEIRESLESCEVAHNLIIMVNPMGEYCISQTYTN